MTQSFPTPTADDAAKMTGDPVGWFTSLLPQANTCRVCGDPTDEHCTECDKCPEDHCSQCGGCVEMGWCTEGCDDGEDEN